MWLNKLRTRTMRIDSNQGIVCCATSEGTGTRIKSSLHLGAGRGIKTSVETAIRGLVRGLEIPGLTVFISVVLDKEVPCQIGVL